MEMYLHEPLMQMSLKKVGIEGKYVSLILTNINMHGNHATSQRLHRYVR